MRPIRWSSRGVFTAGLAIAGLAAAGCGNDSNSPSDNVPPTASFVFSCTDLACAFEDLSSDPDGAVTRHLWAFGDQEGSHAEHPSHTYDAAGDYSVKLTIWDDRSKEASITRTVSVTHSGTQPTNRAPTADFSISCASLRCTFVNSSVDPDGNNTILTWAWDFGDGQTATVANPPVHTYAANGLATFTVKLKVTDNGGLSSTKSVLITVAPPASLTCNGIACVLHLPVRSTVKVTLEDRECTARNNTFRITAPTEETLISDGCYAPPVGTSFRLNRGNAYEAGTDLEAEVISGSIKLETAPALRVTGTFESGWTLQFDDGEEATPPEPDFDDLVIKIRATQVQ